MTREEIDSLPYGAYVIEWNNGKKDVCVLRLDILGIGMNFKTIVFSSRSPSEMAYIYVNDNDIKDIKSMRLLAHVENNEVKVEEYEPITFQEIKVGDSFVRAMDSWDEIRSHVLGSFGIPICAAHSTDNDKDECEGCCGQPKEPKPCPYCGKPVGDDGKCEKGHIGILPPLYRNSLV